MYNVNLTDTCNLTGGVVFNLENVQDYYPYGKTLRKFTGSNGQERFLTTQHERDEETGLDYRGARFYDADIARFLSLDPLASDYPSLSDYAYVAGNPIIFIDPDGKQIIISIGNSDDDETFDVEFKEGKFYRTDNGEEFTEDIQFLNDLKEAYSYISQSEDAKNIFDLIAADQENTVEIQEIVHMALRGDDKEIGWNPVSGLRANAGDQTPALGLLHEMGHTFLKWHPEMLDYFQGSEDDWILQNIESMLQEPQREGHGDGQPFATLGPTSTELETKQSKKERKNNKKLEAVNGATNKIYRY